MTNVLWGAWTALGPVVADRELGGAGPWGIVLGATGVGALLGSVLATRMRPSRPLLFVALIEGLFAMPLAFLAAGASVPALGAGGGALGRRGHARHVRVGDDAPAAACPRSRSRAWRRTTGSARTRSIPLGLAAWGWIAGAIGVQSALWLAFGLFAAAALAFVAVPAMRTYCAPEPTHP